MVTVNYTARELTAKIVYYGPGLCGKTTNLEQIHKLVNPDRRGQLMSLATETDRTLFFDLLPIDVGVINGFDVRLQLFTVPGQTYYNSTRRLVLRGADGIVFVADSKAEQEQANIDSLNNMKENLAENKIDYETIPLVLQYNKQDCKPLIPVERLQKKLNDKDVEYVLSVAMEGKGVKETLKLITKKMVNSLQAKLNRSVTPSGEASASKRRTNAAPIMVKTDHKHIPTVAPVDKEQIERETKVGPMERKHAPAGANQNNAVEAVQDASVKQANEIKEIKKNLAQVMAMNKKLNNQFQVMSTQLNLISEYFQKKVKK